MDWIVTWSIDYGDSDGAVFHLQRSDDHWLDALSNAKVECVRLSEEGFQIISLNIGTLF